MTLIQAQRITAPEGISSTPLFGCSYANFACGSVFHGFVIDDAGRVWSFKHDRTWSPKLAQHSARQGSYDDAWFERAQLLSMYSLAESSARLPLSVVAEYKARIEPVRLGKITRAHRATDAGGSGCTAYAWNAAHDEYQKVTLGENGDFAIANDAPAARVLNRWLRSIEHALAQPPFAEPAATKQRPRRRVRRHP